MPLISIGQGWPVLRLQNAETNQPIPYAKTATQPPIFANEAGFLILAQNSPNQLTITAWNFADTTIFSDQLSQKDTVIIQLRPKPEQLNEVLVNPKNSWLQNKLYGFERWQTPTAWGWAFLIEKELFVTDQKLDLLYKTAVPTIGGKTPKATYHDILGNNYLLGKDSVQQIYITDTAMYGYPQRAESVFNAQIKPLLAGVENGLVYRETKEVDYDVNYLMRQTGTYFEFNIKHPPLHNCGAQITYKDLDTSYLVIEVVDSAMLIAAKNAFGIYTSHYLHFWYVHEDSGYFSPPIKRKMALALHSYKTLFAQYRQTYFLPFNKKYTLFDPYSKQLVTFNQKLEVVKKQPFDFTDCPREEYLYIDQATGQWWLQRRRRGLDVLESVRQGDPPQQITLDPFVRNIRVHNNTVFYLNQYGELRIKKINP